MRRPALGAGVDSRVYRLGPPPTVRWYDVGFPDVIDLRARVYPHFPSGEVVADAYGRIGVRLWKTNSVVRRAGATLRWGIGPEEPAAVGLTLVPVRYADAFVPGEGWRHLPAFHRALCRGTPRIPVPRKMGRLLRYRF